MIGGKTPETRCQGTLLNKGSMAPAKGRSGQTEREKALSEIAYQRRIGNWKRAADLKRHYDRALQSERRASHAKQST